MNEIKINCEGDFSNEIDLEVVMNKDREYFLNNPDKKQYNRPIHPLEILEAQANGRNFDSSYRVTVTEIALGTRIREFHSPSSSYKKKQYKGFGKPR